MLETIKAGEHKLHILVVGLNHRTAPVEMREQFTISEESLQEALLHLKSMQKVRECVIVSTCNRLEIYTVVDRLPLCGHDIKTFLEEWFGTKREEFVPYLYIHEDNDAVKHLFRVASGLDSMIIGETQILGQVRNSFLKAQRLGTTSTIFNQLFKQAVTMAKRVHTETAINENAVSISYVAVELSKRIFGNLKDKTILIIGAGKTGELTVKHLLASGAKRVIVANRTIDKAKELSAYFNGEYCSIEQMESKLMEADVVISSTGAPSTVLTRRQIEQVMSHRNEHSDRPLLMIDIAVPRDLDPEINHVPYVMLYDIDDLEGIVENNMVQRRETALHIENMIAEEMSSFQKWKKTLAVGPLIKALQEKSNTIHEEVMESLFNKLPHLSEREEKVIRKLSKSIVNQMLHDPIENLKAMSAVNNNEEMIQLFTQLFNLEQWSNTNENTNQKVEMLFHKTKSRKKKIQEEMSAPVMLPRELTARS